MSTRDAAPVDAETVGAGEDDATPDGRVDGASAPTVPVQPATTRLSRSARSSTHAHRPVSAPWRPAEADRQADVGTRSPASRPGSSCPSRPSFRSRTSRPCPCSGSWRCCRPPHAGDGSTASSSAARCRRAGADEARSGLAAETTAAAPPTSSSADSEAVRTARLRPKPSRCGRCRLGRRVAARLDRLSGAGRPRGHAIPRETSLDRGSWIGGSMVHFSPWHLRARGHGRRSVEGRPVDRRPVPRSSRRVLRAS